MDAFQRFQAASLFCPKCRQALPVREKLLLFLPDGVLYDYLCADCGTSVGTRKEAVSAGDLLRIRPGEGGPGPSAEAQRRRKA